MLKFGEEHPLSRLGAYHIVKSVPSLGDGPDETRSLEDPQMIEQDAVRHIEPFPNGRKCGGRVVREELDNPPTEKKVKDEKDGEGDEASRSRGQQHETGGPAGDNSNPTAHQVLEIQRLEVHEQYVLNAPIRARVEEGDEDGDREIPIVRGYPDEV